MVKIAAEGLKREDDGQAENHAAEAGCEYAIRKRMNRPRRFSVEEEGEKKRTHEECREGQPNAESFKSSKNSPKIGRKEAIPVREAEEEAERVKVRIDAGFPFP